MKSSCRNNQVFVFTLKARLLQFKLDFMTWKFCQLRRFNLKSHILHCASREVKLQPWRGTEATFIIQKSFNCFIEHRFVGHCVLSYIAAVDQTSHFYFCELTLLRTRPNLQKEIPARCNCGCGIPPIVVLFVPKTFVLVRNVLFAQHQDLANHFGLKWQKPKGNMLHLSFWSEE